MTDTNDVASKEPDGAIAALNLIAHGYSLHANDLAKIARDYLERYECQDSILDPLQIANERDQARIRLNNSVAYINRLHAAIRRVGLDEHPELVGLMAAAPGEPTVTT